MQKTSVLIVSDRELLVGRLRIIAETLSFSHRMALVANVSDAIKVVRSAAYDVVLLDLDSQKDEKVAFAEMVKNRLPKIKRLFTSSRVTDDVRLDLKFRALGCILDSNLNAQRLIESIKNWSFDIPIKREFDDFDDLSLAPDLS